MSSSAAVRLCRVRAGDPSDELPFALDQDGFLAPRHGFSWMSDEPSDGALVTAETAAQSGAFVLLGEPGVGKTTVLRALTGHLAPVDEAAEGEPSLLWLDGIDLTDYTADRLLCRYLERLPAAPDSGSHEPEPELVPRSPQLTVVVDQLDESELRPRLAGRIRDAVRGRDLSGLRWLIACRAVDYPVALTRQLERDGRSAVVADLAPLSREQAVSLATENGVDGEALVAATVDAGAGALASIPLTLRLLADLSRSGVLAGTAQELFDRSVRQLLHEHRDGSSDMNTSTDLLFHIAGRIAARVLLSGRRTIWLGNQLVSGAGQLDISAGTLVAGYEQTSSGLFSVGPHLVNATLRTAVFSSRGADRVAFTHSSISAYLAAWYLSALNVPESQLKSLFLIAADDGSTSIPSPLRETAAWLITLKPSHTSWLVDADPRSLSSYSNLVDNQQTRQALVTAMLRRADELELSDLPWHLYRTRLSYPALAGQLVDVLADAAVAPEPWPDRARARLAIRLAHHAEPDPALTEALLQIAESPQWHPHERRLAIDAIETLNPAAASGRLRKILDTHLRDQTSRETMDPDDEIRGGILLALWPEHLTLSEALQYISPRSNSNMAGAYVVFLRDLPNQVTEHEVSVLLRWAARSADETSDPTTTSWDDVNAGATREADTSSPGAGQGALENVRELIDPLLDRATSWEYGDRFMADVATLVWPTLLYDDAVPMPVPLGLIGTDGLEPNETRQARRALCLALCRHSKALGVPPVTAYRITHGWSNRFAISRRHNHEQSGYQYSKRSWLIDPTDFEWALTAASEALDVGGNDLALLLAHIASEVMAPDDRAAHELAFTYEQTPLWDALRGHFDPIRLDSGIAELVQRRRKRAVAKNEAEFASGEFLDTIMSVWSRAADGDTDAFWQLLWALQFDLQTGRGHLLSAVDDPRQLAAASLLEPTLTGQLPQLALNFVTTTHDHRNNWLGTTTYDKRAWAGYLAIALLDRLARTPELSDHVWQNWVGAILWFDPGAETSGQERRHRLLMVASQHAYQALNNAIPTYVIGEIARGSEPNDLDTNGGELTARHREALYEVTAVIRAALTSNNGADLATTATKPGREPSLTLQLPENDNSHHAARRTLGNLTRALMSARHPATFSQAITAIEQAPPDGPATFEIISADSLLRTGAAELTTTLNLLHENSSLGLKVANHVGSRSHAINQGLNEKELAQLLAWLETLPRTPRDLRRRDWVVHDDGAAEWRDQTLRDLTSRQTAEALEQLNALHARFPDQLDIAAAVITARIAVHASLWTAPEPDDIAELLADSRTRLVRTNQELAALITETLDSIAQDLPSHGEVLWDRQQQPPQTTPLPKQDRRRRATSTWRPKAEAALCAYVAHQIKIRLYERGIAINREVLVQPTDPYGAGDRTDILVEAFPKRNIRSGSEDNTAVRLAVVIEAKGQWNPGLEDDLIGQLAGRYLPEVQTDTGIYLVGWFPPDLWNDARDGRRRQARKRDLERTGELLRERAARLEGSHVTVQIIQAPRPAKDEEQRDR